MSTQIERPLIDAIPAPEPGLTADDFIARARALATDVRADAPAAEKRGRYSEELHEKFRDAGFYRMLQPRYFGGYEIDVASFYRVIVEIAAADPLAWDAGLELFRAASSSNTIDGAPMQRFFRDLAAFKNNAFHQPDFVAPEIARAYFGLPGEYVL